MEKFGLFDLIDKFNLAQNGKNDFAKNTPNPKAERDDSKSSSGLIDPQILPPSHYLMNSKMQDFVKKHDAISKKIDQSTPKR